VESAQQARVVGAEEYKHPRPVNDNAGLKFVVRAGGRDSDGGPRRSTVGGPREENVGRRARLVRVHSVEDGPARLRRDARMRLRIGVRGHAHFRPERWVRWPGSATLGRGARASTRRPRSLGRDRNGSNLPGLHVEAARREGHRSPAGELPAQPSGEGAGSGTVERRRDEHENGGNPDNCEQ